MLRAIPIVSDVNASSLLPQLDSDSQSEVRRFEDVALHAAMIREEHSQEPLLIAGAM